MSHVVTVIPQPIVLEDGRLRLHCVPAAQDNLVWVLETQDHRAIVVDGPNAQPVLDLLDREGLVLDTILTTHTHGDHVGIHHDLARRGRLAGVRVLGAACVAEQIPGITETLVEGDRVCVAGLSFDVWSTEGHLRGHLSYIGHGLLFCGDTLFAGGCGRVFDGPMAAMASSLWRLAALDGDTYVCCAHEYTLDNLKFAGWLEPDNLALQARLEAVCAARALGQCTVPSRMADEVATNPFLRPGSPQIMARLQTLVPHAPLDTSRAVFAAMRGLKDVSAHRDLP